MRSWASAMFYLEFEYVDVCTLMVSKHYTGMPVSPTQKKPETDGKT